MKKNLILIPLLVGLSATASQILILRELLIVFEGNELTIGIILANWLLLIAAGSFLMGRLLSGIQNSRSAFSVLQLIFSLSLPAIVISARFIKGFLGLVPGETMGLGMVFASSFMILLPLCFCVGGLFSSGCRVFSDIKFSRDPVLSIGAFYIAEGAGAFTGGVIFTYLLIFYFSTFQIALVLSVLNALSSFLICKKEKIILRTFSAFAFVAILGTLFFSAERINNFSIRQQWRGFAVKEYKNSIYANIVAAKRKEELVLFLNGAPVSTSPTPDIEYVEELSHFPLLACSHPKDVLLVGGGTSGMLQEILKHPVRQIDYTELDPSIIETAKRYFGQDLNEVFASERVNLIYRDGHAFVKGTLKKYDCIILSLPSPATLQVNRFYTEEFFRSIKKILTKGGVFAFGLPAQEAYMNKQQRDLHRSIYKALSGSFEDNTVIPGNTNIYLAGISHLDPEQIVNVFNARNISARLLHPEYIRYKLQREKIDRTLEMLSADGRIKENLDLRPSGSFYSLIFWNSIFYPRITGAFAFIAELKFWHAVLVTAVLFLLIFFIAKLRKRLKASSVLFTITTTGFASMIINVLLIFSFQIIYGYAYQRLGIIVASIMGGLAAGGLAMSLRLRRPAGLLTLLRIESAVAAYCLFVPVFILALTYNIINPATALSQALIPLLNFIMGFFVGFEFPLANRIFLKDEKDVGKTAGGIYAADLCGAFVGSILVGLILAPILGIVSTCLLLAFLKLLSLLFLSSALKEF